MSVKFWKSWLIRLDFVHYYLQMSEVKKLKKNHIAKLQALSAFCSSY